MNVFPVAKYLKKSSIDLILFIFFSGKLVMKKWANIRDNWMKCHKKSNEEQKSGSGANKRKYLFYEELRFLTKIATHRQTASNVPDNVNLADRQTERQEEDKRNREYKEKLPKNKRVTNELDRKMMTIIDASIEQGQSRIMSFFKGIAPTVDKFHDEDIVDFQYEVMKLIKSITSKQRNSGMRPQSSEVSGNQYHASCGHQTVAGPSSYQTAWTNQQHGHPAYSPAEHSQASTSTSAASNEQMCFESYTSPASTLSNVSETFDFSNEF